MMACLYLNSVGVTSVCVYVCACVYVSVFTSLCV